MVARASYSLDKAHIRPYRAKAGNQIGRGIPVKLDSGEIVACTAIGDDCIGITLVALDGDATKPDADGATAGHTGDVALLGGTGLVAVKVGSSGTATAGSPVKFATAGVSNATVGGGTDKLVVYGQFVESGVSGDIVGMNLGLASYTVGS